MASFTGTDSSDLITVDVGLNSVSVVINNTLSTFGEAGDVDIDGLGGFDTIRFSRTAGLDAVFENGRFEIGNFSIGIERFSFMDFSDGFTILGTSGDDVIEITSLSNIDVSINDTVFSLPAFDIENTNITIDGGDGQDRFVSDFLGTEVFADRTGSLSWVNVVEVEIGSQFESLESLSIFGTEGDDTVSASHTFNGSETVFLPSSGPEVTVIVSGISLTPVIIEAGGGNDSAFLQNGINDSAGFSGSPTASRISSSGTIGSFSTTVRNFDNVTADAGFSFGLFSNTGIRITGSTGDDTATFSPEDRSIEVSGESFSVKVNAINSDDSVILLGGGGDDSIQIDSDESNIRREVTLDGDDLINLRTFSSSQTNSNGSLKNLQLQNFSSVNFAGDELTTFTNRAAGIGLELDASGSIPILRHQNTSFNFAPENQIRLSGGNLDNELLSIIAPLSAPASVTTSQFSAPNTQVSFSNFDLISVLGHDDGSELTIEGSAATERLNFDGENAVVSIDTLTLSTSNFTNTIVNARGGLSDTATLTGDSTGGNTFVASFDGAISTGTITTPDRTLTAVGFDTLEAIAANENDVASINGGGLAERAILGESEFEFINIARDQSVLGTGFALVDIDGGAGRNEVIVEHAFNVSLPEDGVGLHAGSAFRDPSYQLSSFPTVSFAEQNPRVFAIGADVNYVADYSAETASLQRTDNPTQIITTGDFQIFGTASDNDRLNIIAPESEDGTLSFNQFLSANVLAEWFFTETITVEGHNDSGEINILGNSGADTLIFNGQDALLDLSFGIRLGASEFNSIDVNPRGGDDRAFLSGAEGEDNTFEGSVSNNINVGVLRTPSTTITANNFELVGAIAGGENDQAILRGGLNPENLFAGPATARLVASNFVHNAAGFRNVIAQGGQGDFANLTDSQGDDQFTGNSNAATIVFDGGSSVTTTNFTTVRSVSSLGEDEALLEGSAGDDRFVAAGDRFGRLTGTGFSLVAVSYSSVDANGLSGNDIAFLSDSTGNDSFVGAANNSVLSGIGFENTAINFESVSGITSQGNDTAEFRGSQDAERFFASPAAASLTGDGFFLYGRGFDSVAAVGGGGQDIATLQDSEGNDNFTASVSSSVLAGAGFRNVATGFTTVRAFSLSGSDSAVFTGSAGDDQFSGLRPFSYLERAGVRTQANGFSNVFVTGLAGNDTANLFDSDEDETFFGANNNARIEGESYQIQVTDFEAIDLFGFNGGENRLVVNSNTIDYVFRDFGNWIS